VSLSDRLIINAAVTGMVLSKEDNPHLPTSPEEIAACARAVRDEGAAIVHLHARDGGAKPTCDGSAYVEVVSAVREACPDLVVCLSCSGRHVTDPEARLAALRAKPEMASLTVGSMNFPRQAVASPPETICLMATRMCEAGVVPEVEVFEPGHVNYAAYLIRKGVLRPPHYFNLVMGSLGTAPLDLTGMGYMVSLLPPGSTWAAAGIGRFQLDANLMAIAAGGHVRVGLEDNPYYDRGRLELADNARQVRRIVRIAREVGREPATPRQARQIIGLPPR
jgi:uncharacterized protein (DUF849 family)